MGFVKKCFNLVLLLLGFGLFQLSAGELNFQLPGEPVEPVSGEGDFLPDTVNVFHIAKDVSDIFMDAVNGSVYNDIHGDTSLLNKIFVTNYTSNDVGQAYHAAIDQKIKAQRGDFGLNIKGDYTENFTPGLSVDEDLTFKRRFYLGLEWDIIKGGLFDAGNKIHQLKMQSILKEYEILETSEKENYRYLFNYINYIFNEQKLKLLEERKGLIKKQLKFTKELYHLRYVGWEKVLKYQEKLEDIDQYIYQFEKFNKHIAANIPDTLITAGLTAEHLPLFDVDLDSLMMMYYGHHEEDTVTQIKLALYKDQIKWWKDITLKPFVRYNIYENEFNAMRSYGSAGVSLRVPLRFHNKQKLMRSQELIYSSEQFNELEAGGNELVNIYAEFGFKLKQIKSFYYKKILNDELIRKELVKKEYRDVAFNPVYTLGLIDDKKAIESEIVDLKKRMYINLVRLAFYLEDRKPTNFITVLKPSDFTGRYEGSVKMFVTNKDIKANSPEGIVNYLWKNEFMDVIVENNGNELSDDLKLMTEKSSFANIFYTVMKQIPDSGRYPDVAADMSQVLQWDNAQIIGLHYEMNMNSVNDSMSEQDEVDLSDWVSSISSEVSKSSIRLSIGIPSGLSINVLNRIFRKFDLVFVHDTGTPNAERVSSQYASEINLNSDKFVLALSGTNFANRIHLEDYLSNLYNSVGVNNFAFSNFSGMMTVDYKTYEKGHEINLQPGELVASVRDQIYSAEDEDNTVVASIPVSVNSTVKEEISAKKDIIVEDTSTKEAVIAEVTNSNVMAYRIQVAASKVKLSDKFLKRFKAEEIREIRINDYYKYTIGNYQNENEAQVGLDNYKSTSGNTGAFIVRY